MSQTQLLDWVLEGLMYRSHTPETLSPKVVP